MLPPDRVAGAAGIRLLQTVEDLGLGTRCLPPETRLAQGGRVCQNILLVTWLYFEGAYISKPVSMVKMSPFNAMSVVVYFFSFVIVLFLF